MKGFRVCVYVLYELYYGSVRDWIKICMGVLIVRCGVVGKYGWLMSWYVLVEFDMELGEWISEKDREIDEFEFEIDVLIDDCIGKWRRNKC